MRIFYGLYESESGNGLETDLNKTELEQNIDWYAKHTNADKEKDLLVIAYLKVSEDDSYDEDDWFKLYLAKWNGNGKIIEFSFPYSLQISLQVEDNFIIKINDKNIPYYCK